MRHQIPSRAKVITGIAILLILLFFIFVPRALSQATDDTGLVHPVDNGYPISTPEPTATPHMELTGLPSGPPTATPKCHIHEETPEPCSNCESNNLSLIIKWFRTFTRKQFKRE